MSSRFGSSFSIRTLPLLGAGAGTAPRYWRHPRSIQFFALRWLRRAGESGPRVESLQIVRRSRRLERCDQELDGTLVFHILSAGVHEMALDAQLGATLLQANAKGDAMDRI